MHLASCQLKHTAEQSIDLATIILICKRNALLTAGSSPLIKSLYFVKFRFLLPGVPEETKN
ncbi:hypothetical protein BpHYR1_048639 [Brachionus plicatilis]|uniref:Uncharacterized protein n=1 Tax=Brachionus plicatilis TaxID=10195 RepID=A0A3M7P254_BRAPC|nr:hypothetical protein BpHYR1_048639 [Brachionus plicatilis]